MRSVRRPAALRRRGIKARQLAADDSELEKLLIDISSDITPQATIPLIWRARELIYEYRAREKRRGGYPDAASLHQEIDDLARHIDRFNVLVPKLHKDVRRRFYARIGNLRCNEEKPVRRVAAGHSEFERIMSDFSAAARYARDRTPSDKRGPNTDASFKLLVFDLAVAWETVTGTDFSWTVKRKGSTKKASQAATGSTGFIRGVLKAAEIAKPGSEAPAPRKGWDDDDWSAYLDRVGRRVKTELNNADYADEASEASDDEAEDLDEQSDN